MLHPPIGHNPLRLLLHSCLLLCVLCVLQFFMGSAAKYCTVHCESPLIVLH